MSASSIVVRFGRKWWQEIYPDSCRQSHHSNKTFVPTNRPYEQGSCTVSLFTERKIMWRTHFFKKKIMWRTGGFHKTVRPGYRCGPHAALTRTIALEDAAMHATPPVAAPSHSPKNKSCFTFPWQTTHDHWPDMLPPRRDTPPMLSTCNAYN
jgi:hypothetical protein